VRARGYAGAAARHVDVRLLREALSRLLRAENPSPFLVGPRISRITVGITIARL
jgi:hypothetical protein